MATTALDKAGCGCNDASNGSGDRMLPASPFTALQYHFGMLLGVDDLETAQAYTRGKIRLHNAWLHREGVVWGFNVVFNPRNELTVTPGLALDAAGHELHLDATACVDLGKWYEKHKDDPEFAKVFADDHFGGKTFDVHVVARFRACLARPVPAIADPCAGADVDTAFSRVSETVELLLRPGKAPTKDLGYHRLRVLFALEDDPALTEVNATRNAILAMASDQQPREYLKAFREFAALDEIDLAPQHDTDGATTSLFPEDPTEVVLADVPGIDVRPAAAGASTTGFAIVTPPPVPIVKVRRSHVATATIQELLCGPLFAGRVAGPPEPPPSPPAVKTGPTVTAATLSPKSISVTTSRPIAAVTLDRRAFSVTNFDDHDGWSAIDIKGVAVQADGTITVDLKEAPAGSYVRLIASGTGPMPLLADDNKQPLGAPGVGGPDDGTDFVKMFKRS